MHRLDQSQTKQCSDGTVLQKGASYSELVLGTFFEQKGRTLLEPCFTVMLPRCLTSAFVSDGQHLVEKKESAGKKVLEIVPNT